jgi:hypothetical protein
VDVIKLEVVENKIVDIRGQKVLLDSDVAELYGVETRDINKAVKNNPDKFPGGYTFVLNNSEFEDLRGKFSTTKFSKTRVLPKAFTEKGLYMLATILKSPQAVKTTIAIIETYAKIKKLSSNIKTLSVINDDDQKKNLLQKSGEIIAEILDDDLVTNEKETSIEINFAVLKFKRSIKKAGKK